MTTKRYGIDMYDIDPHPQTGAMISGYKCHDLDNGKMVCCGIAPHDDVVALCQRQLELLAITLGAKWAVAVAVVEDRVRS